MRVIGNKIPAYVTVESYGPMQGYVEVRLRENIKLTDDANCEYDEYVLHIKNKEGLQQEIEANLADWLATGRTLEFNQSASAVEDMREALAILEVDE